MLSPLLAGIGVPGPFLAHDLDAVVVVQIDGRRRCGAVYISARLALSIASCFMRSLALTLDEQRACVRGECNGTLVDASSVRLIGGADARAGLVVARVTRIAVRLTAWWAVPAVCTRALCGEGWDVALLELDPSCAHGELPCVPPVHLASVPATIGLAPLAVGFGAHPGFDQRAEFQLSLSGSGGGVRRSSAARVWQVASRQLLQAELSARPGERAGPFCDGDLGAALLTNRSGEWEVEGLHVPGSLVHAQPPTDAAASCAAPSGRVLSAHVVRCWLESIARTWGIGPIVQAHVAECGELDFYPPELAEMRIGAAHSILDCAPPGTEESGQLFVSGESAMTDVKGLTLRRCLTEQQVHHALAPHPSYAVHVAGPARWPETRQGALFRANVWVPD